MFKPHTGMDKSKWVYILDKPDKSYSIHKQTRHTFSPGTEIVQAGCGICGQLQISRTGVG